MRSLRGPVRPGPRPGARATLAALLAVPLLAGVVAVAPAPRPRTTSAPRTPGCRPAPARTPSSWTPRLYLPGPAAADPRPAVVLAHGFGGSKDSVADDARDLAERGYVVLTYSARGFGAQHRADRAGRPALRGRRPLHADRPAGRSATTSSSTAPATRGSASPAAPTAARSSLLGAAYDDRIDAIAPQITWNSLTAALFPSQTGAVDAAATAGGDPADGGTGVYKRLWAGLFFGVGSAPTGGLLGALGGGGDGAAPAPPRRTCSARRPGRGRRRR